MDLEVAEVAAVHIRIFLDEEIKDELCMHKGEMRDMAEIAYGVIRQRAQQALGGKVLKRITYIDDEGDHCTLGPASIIDSLDLCRGGMLDLFVITEEPVDQAVDSTVALEVTHSTLKLDAAPFQEGVQAWTDREYQYKKIPVELLGSILYRPPHIVPTNTYFLVQAPAGSAIYIFSETHRDGGFPGLGWQKCEANRFRWEIPDGSGKHYGLSLWKTISTGEETVIEVFESLVGGIAVKTPVNSNSEAEANAMLEKLMNWVGEANLLTALRKLADKGLDLMAEYQDHFTDEWTPLVTPLHLAASGDFLETNEVISFVRHALEVYRTLPCALQQTVMKAIKGCLDEIVPAQVEMSPQKVEIHKNIICDGCEKDPLIGKRFKCTTCKDFDLCETCHNKRHDIHPEHNFYRMPAPFSLELSVVCDGCGKKKIQPEDRFKCMECPDYDLCASCFDDCSRIHPHHATWEHQGERICIASAPPAEPEPETGLNEGDRNVQMASLGSNSVEEEEKLASSPKEVAESMSQEMIGEKELAEMMLEVDPMMNCPCTPDLDLDEIGQANGGATMAPCTPGTPIPLTPPTFKAFAAMACPTTPPQPKMAWVPQPCTPPFSGEEQMNAHEVDPKVAAVAMAKLLAHPNNVIRQAVVQAMSVAEVEVAVTPKEESVQDSGSDVSDDWERLDGSSENEDWQMQDTATPLPSQPNLVKVLFASTLLSDPTTMQSENKHGVMEWQGTEAYRLGMLEIKHSVSAPTARALVKIVVMNSGKEAWPEASNLSLQSGPSWGFDLMPLGAVTPGETVELVLDLFFTAGHQGDTLASAWAVTDGKGEPIGPRMVLEVVRT